MSETGDKLIPISQRQPVQRRRRKRPVPKTGQKKVINQQPVSSPRETATLARLNNHSSPVPISSGGRKPASRKMMPPGVKPVPTVKKNTQISPSANVRLKTVRMEKPRIESRGSRKTRLKPMARTVLYALRLLIVGVGIGAIVGTLLSILDPANRLGSVALVSQTTTSQKTSQTPNTSLYLSQEITSLKNSLQTLTTANADLMPGVFL
jgi:beta-lactamase class A